VHVDCNELSNWLVSFFKNNEQKLIYDFGCGNAYYLTQLYNNGIKNVVGIEPESPTKNTKFQILPYNLAFELPLTEQGTVISFEVAEHIPEKYQDAFIENITKLCNDYLIISWAIVGQPGIGHVNCKNNEDVILLFEEKGFIFQKELTESIRKCPTGMFQYFKNTLMIFKKHEN
jgi:tryptophanyl-tRNA synthetase